MKSGELKKWLAFGSGVGIAISGADLLVTVVRVRPGGVSILGESTIPNFRNRPATEWGAEYAAFLKTLDAGHRAATVLLPRDEVVVRQLSLPGVGDKDLQSAIRFELDNLQPYTEGEATHGWARIGKTPAVLVGIARQDKINEYSSLFAEAGVKVRALTFSAAVIYAALRVYGNPPAGFLAWSGAEAYGESETKPIFSAEFEDRSPRTGVFALSELRLPNDTEPIELADLLPKPVGASEETNLSLTALPYATALAGVTPLPALSLNLLPEDQRQNTSRLRYIPTGALAGALLLLGTATLAYPHYADRQYLKLVQTEILGLEPRAQQAIALDKQTAAIRNRTQVLDNFRCQTKVDLDAVRELTNQLKPPSFLTSLQMTREQINISGEAEQAAPLLKLLDGSKYFQNSEFTIPLNRAAIGEMFSIRSFRRTVTQ